MKGTKMQWYNDPVKKIIIQVLLSAVLALTPKIAGHNLKNKLALIKFENIGNNTNIY
jgi:hypothetical protein